MDYTTIFDPINWEAVGFSALQTFILYWLLILGIKLAGRRVFGQLGPQDFIILLLIAEASNMGLTHEEGGFWSTVASVVTVLFTGAITERIRPIRMFLDDNAVDLMKNGKQDTKLMKKSLVEKSDLEAAAREYGFPDCSAFEKMTLEPDGSISGVLKPEYRGAPGKIDNKKST